MLIVQERFDLLMLTSTLFLCACSSLSVVGLTEVTFGLLALCPHYTRLSAFVFSQSWDHRATLFQTPNAFRSLVFLILLSPQLV
jgi:hypothetical protein